ncbi:MAG: hypothetical protein U0939_02720 [Pirellulales bacterium]
MTRAPFTDVCRLLRRVVRSAAPCAFALAASLAVVAAADTVELVGGKEAKSATRLSGEIVEIRAGQLTLRRADGREDAYPLARVARWDAAWPAGVDDARRHIREGRYAEAVEQLRAASGRETRAWVKRALVADAVVCFRELNQLQRAGELFASLYQSDPQTPHLDVIPLAWTPVSDPSAAWLELAQRWLSQDDAPALALLGASWLIASGQPERAQSVLQKLSTSRDSRVALLAEAQRWRSLGATAAESELERWPKVVERLPTSLRAGPYYTLGRTLAQRGQSELAVLMYLRVPIEYADQARLAAESLEAAAAELDRLQRADEAQRLRRERTARFAFVP